jgi:aspartyl-tRNA(Asn)/glutamyl-tRNA(Gln) amidotransferase subunit C
MPPASASSADDGSDEAVAPEAVAPEDVSPEHVHRLADLARLDLSDEEAKARADDLGRLLLHAQQLAEVDTEGVEPMPPGAPAVPEEHLRGDEAQKSLSQSEALENAPDADADRFFRTPGVLKE